MIATTTFRTQPFTCPSCVKKIESAIGKLDGVQKVDVMFNSNKVKVTFDHDHFTNQEIADRILMLGYPVTSFSTDRRMATAA